jgi:predicted component of type VI protein secretion system
MPTAISSYVSSRHAVIRYSDGTFFIEDTSTNGVFINSQDNRLIKGQPYALKSGDWIFIEPYEIRASITAAAPAVAASPLADLFPPARTEAPRSEPHGSDDPFGLPRPPAPVRSCT